MKYISTRLKKMSSDLFFDQGVLKTVIRNPYAQKHPKKGDTIAVVYEIHGEGDPVTGNLVYTVGSYLPDSFIPGTTLDRIVTSMGPGEKCSLQIDSRYSGRLDSVSVELTLVYIRAGVAVSSPSAGSSSAIASSDDPLAGLLDSPFLQSMLGDSDMMSSLMDSHPALQELMESNPDLRSVFSDPELLRQSMAMMRNPSLMQEMMRNQDRALSNIESLPGGYAALHKMYNEVQVPLYEATAAARAAPKPRSRQPITNPPVVQSSNFPDMSSFMQQMWGAPSQPIDVSVLYQHQLATLHAMGFTDQDACVRALQRARGDIQHAADILIAEREAAENQCRP
jgi:hypothetical protein